jgi:hypothetical protein
MKRLFAFSIVVAILILAHASADAGAAKMLFWYPGEAGSTLEAQPVLDAFFAAVNKSIAPDAIAGSYFNTIDGGLAYLRKEKPAVGIVSAAAWAQQRDKLGAAKAILATLPLPGGTATERYALVGTASVIKPTAKLLSSEPMTIEFVRAQLFPKLPPAAVITQTPQMFSNLRKIAEGQLDAVALLTPTEAASLARLSAPWAKSLKVIAQSEPIATARVVLFDAGWTAVQKFKDALLSLGADPAAQPMLEEMRLKGFADLP